MYSPTSHHILLIEDNATEAFLTQSALESLAYPSRITHCEDGQKAMDYLHSCVTRGERLPDLLLSDLNMPHLDGLGMLQRIRSNQDFRHLPVVMISSNYSPQDNERVQAEQANGILSKPMTLGGYSQVLEKVDSILKKVN